MTTFASVLRSGGDYGPEHVRALYRGVREHWPGPLDFVCLTDVVLGIEGVREVPLEHGWPGWWSKMELFRPGLFTGPVLYADLDTLPVGDLSDLARYRPVFAMIADFYRPQLAQSGVMMFSPEMAEWVWGAWTAVGPDNAMRRFRGDGEWLHHHTRPVRLQDRFPGQIVSYKVHARSSPPAGARLVCLHGHPRPQHPDAGWAHELWKARAYG